MRRRRRRTTTMHDGNLSHAWLHGVNEVTARRYESCGPRKAVSDCALAHEGMIKILVVIPWASHIILTAVWCVCQSRETWCVCLVSGVCARVQRYSASKACVH